MSEQSADEHEVMTLLGITKVPTYIYRYREWRYSNLADAIAQAKRDAAQVNA